MFVYEVPSSRNPAGSSARDDNGKLMLNCHSTTVNPRNDGAIRVVSV